MDARRRTVGRSALIAALSMVAMLGLTLPASASQPLVATDVAAQAGVAQSTQTWSAPVGDVNNDGLPDFFLSRHLAPSGELYRNDGDGTFTEIDAGNFPQADRLGCIFGDVNQDGRQDIYCSIGDNHSTALNPKELWIQQPDGTFVDEAAQYGVTDPPGRERWPTFIDVNHDGYPDLFVSVFYPRTDGIPESNHLYINQAGTSYVDAPEYGLDTTSGSAGGGGCSQAVDFNNDGWQDLLLCAQDELHLYENEAGTSFTDVTSQVGLGSKVWSDAELVDLNGDGLPDMVQIKKGSAQVRLQRGGVFQPAVKLADLTSGFSLATADVDGNGLPDIYLVQGCQSGSSTNDADLMFLNNGDGTFTQTPIPEASSGCGDVASPSDFNQDGRADMLVLNGFNATGPLQLLTFSAEDTTAPTIQGSVLAKSAGGTPGYLHQGGAYAAYANVSDGPGTGVAAVTANLTAVTTGAASVSLLPCSSGCAVGGVTYAYKSAQQTADAVLSPGIDPYTISATDAAGNASSATFTVTVDNSPPSAVDVQGSNGGTSGTIGSGDVVTATFSKAIDPSSLLAGWAGTSIGVTLSLGDNASAGNDTLTVVGVNLGTVDLGSSKWVRSGATLSATMSLSADGEVLTITLGSCAASCGHVQTGVNTTTMKWTPSASATDLAGNPMRSATVTESVGPKQNF